ncbi:MAG: hypothetical protein IPN76_15410 [Saprospiraceae bacterium]|nr:hypothetical protein [Saprospiraceae bacterium]
MNFLLKNLELELDDRYLLVGEKLLDESKLTRLFENEPHLWIAQVDGYEVEIQISPSRVRAYSCECDQFGREKMCGHVAAGLIGLRRKRFELAAEPKQPAKTKPLTYQKLTINAILDNVTQDELAAFVRSFARTNKQFSLALRAKFAIKVPLFDNHGKFNQLLDAAIQSYRKANDRISASGVIQLQNLLEELQGQADDALALEHFAECWAMLSAIVGRFSPILKKLDGDEEPLKKHIQQTFLKIGQLAAQGLPPSLQSEIRDFCAAEFNRPAYRLNGLSGYLLRTWIILSKDMESFQEVLASLDAELAKPRTDTAYQATLLHLKFELISRPGLEAALKAFTIECLAEPAKLLQLVAAISPTGDFRPIKDLVEKGFRLVPDENIKAQLEPVLLHIAQMEGKKDVIASIARQRFLDTRDFAFYEQCKAHHEGNWRTFVKRLLADLVLRYDFRQNIGTIANILGLESRHKDLLKLLSEQQSLDLLVQFDRYLLKTKPQEVAKLYELLLKNYLADHLGLKASKKIRSIFEHLDKQGAASISEQLLDAMKTAFPKRIFYLDEMEAVQF